MNSDLSIQIEKIAQKQEQALRAAVKSSKNVCKLSLEEVRIVCGSLRPTPLSKPSHKAYWEKMDAIPISELVSKFEQEIQNRRILIEVLGNGE